MPQKTTLVLGAGGFVGGHLVKRLKAEGCWVRGVDLTPHAYSPDSADEFVIGDLRAPDFVSAILDRGFDEVYQLAADMGGAGYIFTGENDANVMHNSALINLNVLEACRLRGVKRVFYSSSACIYPKHNQSDPGTPDCAESSAYPADPDSEYGWEKLFSERLYLAYNRNHGMACRIARYHNVFGPEGAWRGGREKAPSALCRKVAEAQSGGSVDVWGDGLQTRSFLHVDECVEGTLRLLRSDVDEPVNIGSDEMVTINALMQMIVGISGKSLDIRHVDGPQGVRGRNSDNRMIREKLGWSPQRPLRDGLAQTYSWIAEQADARAARQTGTGEQTAMARSTAPGPSVAANEGQARPAPAAAGSPQ